MKEFVKDSDIFAVDALYFEPQLASIHLVRQQDQIAIIDTGAQYSVPQVEKALTELGLSFASVELIILTHIHLDHAGGAGALMALCPNAQLVVHPKGARHMVNPEKLIAGSKAVYGEDTFAKIYGDILAVEESRLLVPEIDLDKTQLINMQGREFELIDTPGHASHHLCIFDKKTNSVFTGDTLGVAYRSLRDPDHAFVMPTTTPVQFNPEALHASIDRVMSYQPETLYYTHYSALQPSTRNIAGLHEQIEDFVLLTEQAAEHGERMEEELGRSVQDYLIRRAMSELKTVEESVIQHWVKLDAKLNAQGLAYWWQYRR